MDVYSTILVNMKEKDDIRSQLARKVLARLIPQEEIDNPQSEFVLEQTARADENGDLRVEDKIIHLNIGEDQLKD